MLADLLDLLALDEARQVRIHDQQRHAGVGGRGSVFATTITWSQLMPLVMNVFWPLRT